MKPETRTVTQLFELDVRYVVPLYQRPYVWQEESQWQPLWDDIVTLLEHQENGNGQHYSHFLGAIVLEQETLAPGEIPIFTVIDGQQRLTTLQILLTAASNVAKEQGALNDGEIIRDLVMNDEKKAEGVARFKVWPTNANRDAFEAVLAEGGPSDERPDDPDNRIDEAYAFFSAQVREWAGEVEGDDRIRRLRLLRITLCDLLKVVSITLEAAATGAEASAASLRETADTVRGFAESAAAAAGELREVTTRARAVLEGGAALLDGGALRAIEQRLEEVASMVQESQSATATALTEVRESVARIDKGASHIFANTLPRRQKNLEYPGE